ncbi:nodulin MtN21 /EamA-like transporter family protein [Arabidopsis thaliana]|nr:nodulin MtN21 /EamA-like transporter family protein [Arabidopsis thaliana]ANM65608.1 nodulin MtN21 /EamA-like transporter family protein [Arabidopsis thaliana]|eukprot:NP_001327565.1 nodulin MtN21 /EamA-like transporter family protein [Arabidopsis thaliana]
MYVITGGIGIEYSNPTLASAIGNIVPALTFILAVIFRMEKVSFKERSSVAKVMGTILSLIGAFVVIFYHGPRVFVASSPPYLNFRQLSPPLSSSKSDWLIGGAILTIQGIFVSVSFILQGIITSVYYVIHSWAIRHKRPLYLAIFKPLSILIAVVMGTIFLNDSLYLGCLIGGILITLGFYVVMWGKANEEKNKLLSFSGKEKTPLLLSGKNDQI